MLTPYSFPSNELWIIVDVFRICDHCGGSTHTTETIVTRGYLDCWLTYRDKTVARLYHGDYEVVEMAPEEIYLSFEGANTALQVRP